ncbi:hypothetical protein PSPO01_00700 [Paraphaeosphaeria sporulosa]
MRAGLGLSLRDLEPVILSPVRSCAQSHPLRSSLLGFSDARTRLVGARNDDAARLVGLLVGLFDSSLTHAGLRLSSESRVIFAPTGLHGAKEQGDEDARMLLLRRGAVRLIDFMPRRRISHATQNVTSRERLAGQADNTSFGCIRPVVLGRPMRRTRCVGDAVMLKTIPGERPDYGRLLRCRTAVSKGSASKAREVVAYVPCFLTYDKMGYAQRKFAAGEPKQEVPPANVSRNSTSSSKGGT